MSLVVSLPHVDHRMIGGVDVSWNQNHVLWLLLSLKALNLIVERAL
jgi:hypothetical protein